MCIIASKPAGAKLPTLDECKVMWDANPDGAGLMWSQDGKVHIVRALMTWDKFRRAYKALQSRVDTTATPVVMHFRIATHGGVNGAGTHPFVVGRQDVWYTHATCDLGVAHNGIIPGYGSRIISDTAEFNATLLADMLELDPDFVHAADAKRFLESQIGYSRLAFLAGAGDIIRMGHGWEQAPSGVWYSNHSYTGRR